MNDDDMLIIVSYHEQIFFCLSLTSDGVHDDFDAPSLGVRPGDVDPQLAEFPTWEEADKAKSSLVKVAKDKFMLIHLFIVK